MTTRGACSFLTGVSVGAGIALMFAPRSGRQMRAQIAETAADSVNYAKQRGGEVRDTARELVDRGKGEIARQKEGLSEGVRRGVEAYQEATRRQV